MNTLVSEKKIISKSTKRARQSGVVTESLDITPEDAVISILSEILHRQLETAHLQKSFIELGGHSMAAYEFIDKINSRLGIDIGLSELLSMPSTPDPQQCFKRWSDYVFVTKEDVWVVEGAGHYLLVERPERIAEILGPILKRVETGL